MMEVMNPSAADDVFSHVDWDKVARFFQRTAEPDRKSKIHLDRADKFLRAVAEAGARGLVFVFNAHKPGAEGILLGEYQIIDWRKKQILSRFRKQKYVQIQEKSDGTITVKLTQDGLTRALTYKLDSLALNGKETWDHKWRVIIFDIAEKHKYLRDVFRTRLKQLGLYEFQKSVYVSPYPCFDEVEFLCELFGVAVSVRYLLAEKIEDDEALRAHFRVS